MRMRELERQTGVGRETIRFYIREGLLPEPLRLTRNSAVYTEDHVTRLRAIKRLQEERFLPLSVIKTLLNAGDGDGDGWLHAEAFPRLDSLVRARLAERDVRLGLDEVMAQTGQSREGIEEAARNGIVSVDADGRMTQRDAAILRVLVDLGRIGFTRERGFTGERARLYVEFIEWLVGEEIRNFFDRTAGHVSEEEAAAMVERGIAGINDLLGLLRTREVLRRLEARRHVANDNQ